MKWIIIPVGAICGAGLAAGLIYAFGGLSSGDKSATSVMIAGVQGAPGDGNTALSDAFRTMLANANISVSDDMTACSVAVSAEVGTQIKAADELVSIVWQVHDSEGGLIAEVSQATRVDPGSLDVAWGTDASLAARGARDRILPIMQKALKGCA